LMSLSMVAKASSRVGALHCDMTRVEAIEAFAYQVSSYWASGSR
jgi:hypothetical protein